MTPTARPDRSPITARRARALAVDAIVNCFASEQAGEFEGIGDGEWIDHAPDIMETTDTGFLFVIGGHRIRFRATTERKSS